MKKTMRIAVIVLLIFAFSALPFFAQKTEYQIGESEGGLLNDGKLKAAFQKAADKFKDWMYEGIPSGYVTQTEDYYMQTYTDGEDRGAAIYVGADYEPYVLRGPIYEQLDSVGGLKTLGRPRSDAYEVNGVWYQNFEKGHVTVKKDGKATFLTGQTVDEQGNISPITDSASTDSASSMGSAGMTTDGTTDSTVSSPSQVVSDVVQDVEEVAPCWAAWVAVLLLILAVVILLVYWFLKRR